MPANYYPGKKNRHCSGHNLGKDKLTQYWFLMWFVDVFFTIEGYDAVKNYMFLEIHNWCKWLDCNMEK